MQRATEEAKREKEVRKERVAALAIVKRPGLHGGAIYKHAIVASSLSFVYFITYGAAVASLGAALPFLESAIEDASREDLAWVFTTRGAGFLFGTILSALLLEGVSLPFGIVYIPPFWFTEHKLLLFSVSSVLIGGSTALLLSTTNYAAILFIFFMQGVGFGGADTIGNCLLPELWSEEVNPPMQALHCGFGVGGIIGPALVGSIGYFWTFITIGISSLVPVIVYPYVLILRKIALAQNVSETQEETVLGAISLDIEGEKEKGSRETAEKASLATVKVTTKSTEEKETAALLPLPRDIHALVILFFLVYVGSESSYGGWITSYVLDIGVTFDKNEAAFVTAVYWGGLTLGRLFAIPIATRFSTNTHLRCQLALAIIGAVLALTVLDTNFVLACTTSALYGVALSAMFPLALTLVNEYGFVVDPTATATFMCAACGGDAVIPVIIGLCMSAFGPEALPRTIAVFAVLLVIVYAMIAYQAISQQKEQNGSDAPSKGEMEDRQGQVEEEEVPFSTP